MFSQIYYFLDTFYHLMSIFTINKIDAIDSTNEALKREYRRGKLNNGEGLWAGVQTQGKGQHQGNWVAEANKNITFSFFLDHHQLQSAQLFHLNCLISLAIKKALEHLKIPNISIKWPNDILSDDKKIAGILIENLYRGSQLKGCVVGIGLNVNQEDFTTFPHASSMRRCASKDFELDLVLAQLLESIEFYLNKKMSYQSLLGDYNDCLYKRFETCLFEKQSETFMATIVGVNSAGLLMLEIDGNSSVHALKTLKMIY